MIFIYSSLENPITWPNVSGYILTLTFALYNVMYIFIIENIISVFESMAARLTALTESEEMRENEPTFILEFNSGVSAQLLYAHPLL